jgi:hypothetical protein
VDNGTRASLAQAGVGQALLAGTAVGAVLVAIEATVHLVMQIPGFIILTRML